jgi:hypothetical protein
LKTMIINMGKSRWNESFIGQKFIHILILLLILNGCIENKVDVSKIQNINNKEAISYFTDVGFNKKKILKKWKRDMMVSISGKYDEYDLNSIDEFIGVFNELSKQVKMKRIEKGGNIQIYFGEDKRFNPKGYMGLTSTRGPLFSNEVTTAKIWIVPNYVNTIQKRHFIHHELLHAIGLKDSKKVYGSYNMMGIKVYNSIDDFEKQTQDIQSSKLDKWAIEIMYDNEIKTGLSKEIFINSVN